MQIIPFSSLVIPENRQRRHFDAPALTELARSIQSKGLLHPPVVRPVGETFELLVGERRTKALRALAATGVEIQCNAQPIPVGSLPVILIGDLSPLLLREAELEENTIRENLTWQEQAEAVAELDSLRKEQAAESGASHSTSALATELIGRVAVGSEITKVQDTLIVAQHLADPDVAKAKSAKEAMKVIKKKAEVLHREKLAEMFNPISTPHNAIMGSCFTYASAIPSSSQDVILTDPPYGVGADAFGDMASTTHEYADTYEYAMTCYDLVATEGFRVAKPLAHLYVFLDVRYWSEISLKFLTAGWDVWPFPLIWDKSNGMLPKPDLGPRRTYEVILFANKGNRKVLRVAPDILRHSVVSDKTHGAQKPVSLYQDLLSRSCYPGNSVVDFFSGSGTIFPAANRLKLIATGIEQVPDSYNQGLARLDAKEENAELDAILQGDLA